MKAQELRELNPEEIERKLKEAKENLFKLKVKLSTKQLEKTAGIKILKREIARMKTVLQEKKKGKEAVNAGKK
jgi:large subunit ribosomal protein L29